MNTRRLDKILTPAGLDALCTFINTRDLQPRATYHSDLKAIIRPHLLHPEEWDLDFLAYMLEYQLTTGRAV